MPDLPFDLSALLEGYNVGLSANSGLAVGVLLLAALLLAVGLSRVAAPNKVSLRPIAGYERMKQAITDAAETGQVIHLAAGTGSLGTAATADTLAGVDAVSALAGRAAAVGVPALVTTPNGPLFPLLQTTTESAYQRAGVLDEFKPTQVRFVGENRLAYGVHIADIFQGEHVGASALIGSLGDETLLIGERGRMADLVQVMGTASPGGLIYAMITANHTIIGEEMYAARAYLAPRPVHLASLFAQDWLRLIIVVAVIIGVVLRTGGWW